MKPFRPPAFLRPDSTNSEPPLKKRRITSGQPSPGSTTTDRKPLASVSNPAPSQPLPDSGNGSYYTVLWRKYSTKKNKTWDGDGVLAVVGGSASLTDSDTGKELGKGACNRPLLPGSALSIGGKEIEIDAVIEKTDYLSGRMFLGTAAAASSKQEKRVEPGPKPSPSTLKPKKAGGMFGTAIAEFKDKGDVPEHKPSTARKQQFKTPLLSNTVLPQRNSSIPQPRHDPNLPNALVMKRPSPVPKGKQIVDVVVDPVLSKHLREHQREGVKFLYECVMGMRCEGEGAIMADEMGLGKTLQTITLLWTLMKQNPVHESQPVVKKALIVCPAGLVDNWKREIRKWLGNERIGIFVANGKDKRITDFTMGKAYNVMIIGYEMLRTVQEELQKGRGVDIVIADEGHRLKTANNKAMLAIQSLNTERRIILSGTPLQNDLGEFYTAIDFVNPGLLGQRSAFKRTFEAPILRSRQPEASESELEKGEARWKELVALTSRFMIRRTAEVLSKYLPPKTEHIVFCRPTKAQAEAYRAILASPIFAAAMGSTDMALQLIMVLKKICNSPSLLKSKKDDEATPSEMLQALLPLIPPQVLNSQASSTKLRLLDTLVHKIYTTTEEKIVIVSNYTTTLDMIERLLVSLSYTYLRLDGSTPSGKRQGLVEKFNKTPKTTSFAFLLSAKSGGVGLNLIGASRIVLFDIDWNPATDLQAMARIHRDGQKRPVKIYRFLVQGSIDEKIYQRQVMKMGLANAVVDNKASASSFSKEELRDLFRLDEREGCQTHDLLGCTCDCRGSPEDKLESELEEDEDDDDDEDDDEDDFPSLKPASQVDMDAQESKIKARRAAKQPKLRMLMEYQHLDTKVLKENTGKELDDAMALAVDDNVFLDVLKEPGCNVGFLLTKSSS
jgi:DNA repair and recombination protein RAD54B